MKCYAETYCKKRKNECNEFCDGYRLLRALYKMSRIPERYCYNIPLVPEGKDLGAFEALNDFMKSVEERVERDGKGKVRECFQVSLDGCKRLSNKLKGELREEFLIAVGLRLENGSEGQNTKPESEPEKEYTLEEAAAELGISRRTLGRKIDAGEIQTEKREYQQILIKERSIVTESALEAYRKSLEVE